MSYKHLIVSVVLTGVYFFGTYVGQLAQQGKPIYGQYLNWSKSSKGYNEPDWNKNFIFIGCVFGAIIVIQIIMTLLSNKKSSIYFRYEAQIKER